LINSGRKILTYKFKGIGIVRKELEEQNKKIYNHSGFIIKPWYSINFLQRHKGNFMEKTVLSPFGLHTSEYWITIWLKRTLLLPSYCSTGFDLNYEPLHEN
jgi:hypothetical protein